MVDSQQAVVREEEEDKDSLDTVQDSAWFFREEEVETVESVEAAAEEDLAQAVAAVAVPAWAAGADPSWTSLRSFGMPSRRLLQSPCRVSKPSTQRQWRHARRLTTGGEASPPSCERTSATSAESQGMRTSPPYGGIWH